MAFQSTPPVKAATCDAAFALGGFAISIHAAREGGDRLCVNTFLCAGISIHAAREGGDFGVLDTPTPEDISIHAAREGGDARRCP